MQHAAPVREAASVNASARDRTWTKPGTPRVSTALACAETQRFLAEARAIRLRLSN